MNIILQIWNEANEADALASMLACCGSTQWAEDMVALRPIADEDEFCETADRVWAKMEEPDWLEAFACHPRIGERKTETSQHATWSSQEQAGVQSSAQYIVSMLADGNVEYENRFGFTYIVCATGKSALQMLDILQHRLKNTRDVELRQAAEQQRQIMQIRIGKWLKK